ncbi:MAG: PfkB family carbohydrate kinase, partial [Alphaproteobacteria bacterium]|nr:PfkB family carbohydrate kinase [Alphaproteobacteria bacterium]
EVKSIISWEPDSIEECKEAAISVAAHTKRGAIVTAGAAGVAWSIDGQNGSLQAPKVDAIDTVAAGDCFNAGLAAALVDNYPIEKAVAFASHVAALATTKKGASESAPNAEEVFRFMENNHIIISQDQRVVA